MNTCSIYLKKIINISTNLHFIYILEAYDNNNNWLSQHGLIKNVFADFKAMLVIACLRKLTVIE